MAEVNQPGSLPTWDSIKPNVQRLKWDNGQSRVVVMIGNAPKNHIDFKKKDKDGKEFEERLFVFSCQEAGKDCEICTSSENLLSQLKRFEPLNGRCLRITKQSKAGKSFFVVEQVEGKDSVIATVQK